MDNATTVIDVSVNIIVSKELKYTISVIITNRQKLHHMTNNGREMKEKQHTNT